MKLFRKANPLIATGLDFPEGPVYDRHGNLYLCQLRSGDISVVRPDGRLEDVINTGGNPNGAALDREGHLLVADSGKNSILRISPDADVLTLADGYQGEPLRGPNDLVVAADDSVYFTTPVGSNEDNPIGRVYRLHPGGRVDLIAERLAFPNGIALSADGSVLYVAETRRRHVLRLALDARGMPAGEAEIFAVLRPVGEGPDGMAFDVEGCLYVAHYGGGCVAVFGPDGTKEREIPIEGANPTNVAFGGRDMKTLYVTEAERGNVFALRMPVAGRALL